MASHRHGQSNVLVPLMLDSQRCMVSNEMDIVSHWHDQSSVLKSSMID
jgi:hypothetical protein